MCVCLFVSFKSVAGYGGYGVSKVISPYGVAPAIHAGYGIPKVVSPVVSHGYGAHAIGTNKFKTF